MFCLYIVLFTSNILVYAQITMLVSSSLHSDHPCLFTVSLIDITPNTFVKCCYVTRFPLITVIIVIRCQFTFKGMFLLKMMFVYCRISLCNAVSSIAGKGEGWYIIMAVFSDILYKSSDRACCYHRLLLILCIEPIHDTLRQMSFHVNL